MHEATNRDRLPPGQQLVAPGKWPVIGERKPAQSNAPWTLTFAGSLASPIEMSHDDLLSMPQTEMTLDIHCVTRWSKYDMTFEGVLLSELLEQVAPNENANFVSFISRSERNHSSSLAIETAVQQKTMIALKVDGELLGEGHGGPIRNIVPGRYFYKSVKWLEKIELLEEDRLGFWEAESGYHNVADPWQEQRYMAPDIDRRLSIRLIETRDFTGHDLRSIEASERDLAGLNAKGAQLRDAKFNKTNLEGADFRNANVSNGHFVKANLAGATFVDGDVEGADFSGANLSGADFTNCSLIGASFFSIVDGKTDAATFDHDTKMPDDVIAPLFPEQLKFVQEQLQGLS